MRPCAVSFPDPRGFSAFQVSVTMRTPARSMWSTMAGEAASSLPFSIVRRAAVRSPSRMGSISAAVRATASQSGWTAAWEARVGATRSKKRADCSTVSVSGMKTAKHWHQEKRLIPRRVRCVRASRKSVSTPRRTTVSSPGPKAMLPPERSEGSVGQASRSSVSACRSNMRVFFTGLLSAVHGRTSAPL